MGRPKKNAANTQTFTAASGANVTKLDFGTLNPKQAEFWKSKARYTCYGGAKGGGKSHVVDRKIAYGCLKYEGMRALLLRRQFKDLLKNHIEPLQKLLPTNVARYNSQTQTMHFDATGSSITFGHYNYDSSADSFNGQEYDWIFIDEATQFTFEQFTTLRGCLRGVNKIPKQMFLTCNPGGVGHKWVKRLFIDRDFVTDAEDPELNENPKDYKFVFANIEDNIAMKENDPEGFRAYLSTLKQMPEKVRDAYRYGIWDDLGGSYFDEFKTSKHVTKPFKIPSEWRRYRAFDYGFDMFACFWIAADFEGHYYVYREYLMGKDLKEDGGGRGLTVSEAAQAVHDNTLPDEHIDITFAPPDMWNTQSISGKCAAEVFMLNDVAIVRANNNRVQGHLQIKEMLADLPEKNKPKDQWRPQLLFFDNCKHLIGDIAAIQSDEKNPNDCAKEPHDITHTVDALRYFCISRTMPAFKEQERSRYFEDDEGETVEDYDSYLCGGEISQSYLNY